MSKYDDIINLPHHVSKNRTPMSMANRAAQFAPFAALTGHDAAIAETTRQTSKKVELTSAEQDALSRRLAYALEQNAPVSILYFQSDYVKDGGRYLTVTDVVKKIEEYESRIVLTSGTTIPLTNIYSIEGDVFDDFA